MTAQQPEEEADKTEPQTYSQAIAIAQPYATQQAQPKTEPSQEADLNAIKRDKKGKGKGNGYGEC